MAKKKAKLTNRYISSLKPADKLYRVWDSEIPSFFVKVRPSGVISYGLYYRAEGKLKEFTIGKHGALTLDEARTEAKSFAGDIAKGVDIQADKVKRRHDAEAKRLLLLENFVTEKYKPWVLAERKQGAATLDRLKLQFGHLYQKPMPDISTWIITKWRSGRLKQGISPKTVNRDINTLRSVLSRAVEWGFLDVHPLAGLKQLKVDNRESRRFLSDIEEEDFRQALDEREEEIKRGRESGNAWRKQRGYDLKDEYDRNQFADYLKPLMLVLLNAGLRPAEAFQLEWRDVTLQGQPMLTVRGETSKSSRTRHIPLNREALGVLLQWRNQTVSSGLVFPSPKTGKSLVQIPKAIYKVIKQAKLEGFRPYDLRHTFASRLVMAGADLNTVRELLGHSDIATTLIYAHLAPDHKAAAVALLD
jgi:integrase